MNLLLTHLFSNPLLRDALLPVDTYPIPVPFCLDRTKIKAFVLGADPSNNSQNGSTKKFSSVFNLDSGDNRYFRGPLEGLNVLGISISEVYVQNVIRNYCTEKTGSNKLWDNIAAYWIDELCNEFDLVDPSKKIPVLLTAEKIYQFLLRPGLKRIPAKRFYSCSVDIPIEASLNLLNRPLIPFYRFRRGKNNYWLNNPQWGQYATRVKDLFDRQ